MKRFSGQGAENSDTLCKSRHSFGEILDLEMKYLSSFAVVLMVLFPAFVSQVGCVGGSSESEAEFIWGERGITDGRLQKPRAVAIDPEDNLYIVDMTARIQVFDADGKFQHGWKTPESKNGRPSGLSMDRDGRLLVADTHYFRMLVYDVDGTPIPEGTIGGTEGKASGKFGFVTDVVQDSQRNFYIAEYGTNDRVQKFSPTGDFLLQWGSHGEELGQFRRPQNMAIDAKDRIWITDACNHRIQVFDTNGKLLDHWGREGSGVGELYYPYDIVLDEHNHVYICEYGNHRVQKFTPDGKPIASWGTNGRGPGQLHNPWALVRDSRGRLHILDSNNHRVQRVVF